MVSTTDIIDRLKIFKAQSASKYKIKFMGLFGSYARQQQDEKSDVDVFICLQEPDFFVMEQIKEELEVLEVLLHSSIDLVNFRESLRPTLKKNILKDAIYI